MSSIASSATQPTPTALPANLSDLKRMFLDPATPVAYSSIKEIEKRPSFVSALEERATDSTRINQLYTPLCGPAAFMYCVARRDPDRYQRYVLELAIAGEARLGQLHVKPSAQCRNARLETNIDPVDWVALASLRDSANGLFSMSGPGANVAGITTPHDLETWFDRCDLFMGTGNHSRLATGGSFTDLLNANMAYITGAYVCLLLRGAVIGGGGGLGVNKIGWGTPKTPLFTPDHWIVMRSSMTMGGRAAPSPTDPYAAKRASEPLNFEAFTWGRKLSIQSAAPGRTCEQFLLYFYGFVTVR